MKKFLMISALLSCIVSNTCIAQPSGQPLDQMVAVVNDELITRSELSNEVKAAKMQITQQGNLSVSDKTLEKQVLQQLINKKLQLQTATQAGVTISDQEVEDAIKRIASQNNVSVDALYDHVKQTGMSAANYRHEIHDQIIVQKLQQHEVAGKVTITPEEVTAFMKSNSFRESGPKEYRLQDILIPVSDAPSPAELAAAKARAETILTKLQSGTPFNQLAQAESRGATALQGGDLGWRQLADIPSAFTDNVVSMKKEGLAGPIQAPNGFHILRLTDLRTTSSNSAPTDRKTVESMLLQQKFEVAVQSWMSKLRSTAFITTAV